jgi:hypothetical protein
MSKNEFSSVDEAIEMLSKGIVDITFIKKTDGSIRTMHSTLYKPYIPYGEYDTVNSVIVNSLSSDGSTPMVVYDLYSKGWRSFYMGSTIEIQEVLEFGDTTEMVQEMVQEKVSSGDEKVLADEDRDGIISNIVNIVRGRIEKAKEEAPERAAAYSMTIIRQVISNIMRNIKKL